MTRKDNLIECFKVAMDYVQKYVAVKVELPNDKFEVIVFGRNAFFDKMNYYDANYNDELELVRSPEVKIIDFCCANDFESIELELLGE